MATGPTISLQDAVDSLYRIAVTEEKTTSTIRLQSLANYCIQQLSVRGLLNAKAEAQIPGGGRPKQWDVSWSYHQKWFIREFRG